MTLTPVKGITSTEGNGSSTSGIGFMSGYVPSLAADTDHDIDFGTGTTRDSTNTYDIIEASAKIKQIDATWAAGTNAGGLAEGESIPISGTLHLFVLYKSTDGTTDAGFDTSVAGTNLLTDSVVTAAGFDILRRIGSIVTDATSNIIAGTWTEKTGGGTYFGYSTLIDEGFTITTSYAAYTHSVPTGLNLDIDLGVHFAVGISLMRILATDFYVADKEICTCNNGDGLSFPRLTTDTSAQIQYKRDQTVVREEWKLYGYTDERL